MDVEDDIVEIAPPQPAHEAINFGHTANVISLLSSEPIGKKEFNENNNFKEIHMTDVPDSAGAVVEVEYGDSETEQDINELDDLVKSMMGTNQKDIILPADKNSSNPHQSFQSSDR